MSWENALSAALKAQDVRHIAYLPDSAVWPLIERLQSDEWFDLHLVSREEEAVGLLAGSWLGGKRGALICQTSGLANTFNVLAGVNKAWGLPFIGIVSRRGALGEHNRSQVPGGYAMPRLLDEIGVRNESLTDETNLAHTADLAIRTAFSTEEPYVLFLERQLTEAEQ